MNLHIIDPLSDHRWDDLVDRHPDASAFHQRGWLEALAATYGHKPLVVTTASPSEPLKNGLVLCRVSSWITGTRLVSLPFADHCEPLLNGDGVSGEFIDYLQQECDRRRWRYVELRPLSFAPCAADGLEASGSFWTHELDTRPGLQELFDGLHKNSFRRKLRRAEREGLSFEKGRSKQIVDEFYHLLLLTRRRHNLLPQPFAWFRNLVRYLGESVEISLARKDGMAIGAMLSLRHKSSIVYKYGCSNARFHKSGAMPFLFWKLIEQAKAVNADRIYLGRTDLDNEGLIRFKDRLGAAKRLATYYRYSHEKREASAGWGSRGFTNFCSLLPDTLFATAGGMLYRHIG